ncbi:MAG: hypothetical protein IPJ30_21800 [Acidobacteria bacterium]|nr:hypothetical protein [Acidobacteriota bacterium]
MLGSPRVITDSEGNVISRRDFLPFGEEISPDIGARSSIAAYQPANDNVKQKFTGYQKDDETGLDFAEARMYENRHGRFTAVDPLLASGKSANPQTFNRFVYGLNNPIVMIDSDGQYPVYFLQKDGKVIYSTVRKTKEWKRYYGEPTTFISEADNSTKNKLVTVSRSRITVIPTGLETDENARSSVRDFNELDSRQKELIRSLAYNSQTKGKLVSILAGGAVLVGTGAGFYLYAAGATTGTLLELGIAGNEVLKRNPQGFNALVEWINKPTPQGLIVNLGGNAPRANVNIDINRLSNVPNLIQGNASNIEQLLANSKWAGQRVSEIQASQFTSINMNWSQFANGAFNVMEKGGKVLLNIHGNGNLDVINKQIVPALQKAGFTQISVFENVVTAIR